jgi:thiamine monophosphate kinase
MQLLNISICYRGGTQLRHKGLIISILIGEADETEIVVYRNGAKQTDLLVVTGDIGAAYMGLLKFKSEEKTEVSGGNLILTGLRRL